MSMGSPDRSRGESLPERGRQAHGIAGDQAGNDHSRHRDRNRPVRSRIRRKTERNGDGLCDRHRQQLRQSRERGGQAEGARQSPPCPGHGQGRGRILRPAKVRSDHAHARELIVRQDGFPRQDAGLPDGKRPFGCRCLQRGDSVFGAGLCRPFPGLDQGTLVGIPRQPFLEVPQRFDSAIDPGASSGGRTLRRPAESHHRRFQSNAARHAFRPGFRPWAGLEK